jgi:hypothetical protein
MQLHLKQLPREIAMSYAARTNIALLSKPAVGKSQTMNAIALQLGERIDNFKLWYLDMTTATPNDIVAYMPDVATGTLVAYPNADLPNAYTHPNAVGIVFEDECLNADPMTAKVFQKYNNGESIGGRLRKPDGVIIVAASNRMADKSGVMQQSRAFMSRFEQVEVYSDAKHNLGFMEANAWFPMVTRFLEKHPDLIDNYDDVFFPNEKGKQQSAEVRSEQNEEGKRGVWANMRTWERISKLEFAAREFKTEMRPERALANVGRAVGQQYVTYRAMYDKIASVDDIIANPKKIGIPERTDELYVTVCMLTGLVPQEHVKQAGQYIDRLSGELRALAIRRLVKRTKASKAGEFNIIGTPEYTAWMQDPAISDLFMATK